MRFSINSYVRIFLFSFYTLFFCFWHGCKDETNAPTSKTVSKPVFRPAGGTYKEALFVVISCSTDGATIHYTVDGSNPSRTNGTIINSGDSLSIDSSKTLKAIAFMSDWIDSDIAIAIYTITRTVAIPDFDPSGCLFEESQTIIISCSAPGATIRYTIDSTNPSHTNGTIISSGQSITIAQTTTLKAIAYLDGWDDSPIASTTYTLKFNYWTTNVSMPTKRGFFASAVVNNVIYVIGGGNGYAGVVIGGRYPDLLSMVEAYDPETNTWTQRTSMPTSRKDHTCTVVNNIIYVIGGRDTSNVEISTVEAYDPLSDSWTNKAPMQLPRSGLSCAVVNNIIYAIGGAQGCVVEAYNPLTNIWTSKANMPSYRDYLTCAVVNNIIYTIGGKYYDGYGGSGVCSIVEAYDPLSNTWTKKSYMPTSRYYLASAVVNNKIFVIGGQSEYNNSLALLEIYDPSTDIWTTNVPSMPTARFGLVCSTTNNKIYAIGGCTMSNVYPGPQIVYDYYNCVEVFHP